MTRLWSRSLALVGLAAGLVGCTPELAPIRWEPVDLDALVEALANPTGIVDEASANEVAAAIVERQGPYQALSGFLGQVFAEAAGSQAPPWVFAQALDGTSVYMLIACPGPLGSEDAPFSHGYLRLDSPTLTAEVLATYEVHGQLRLQFDACLIDDYRYDGEATGVREIAVDALLGIEPEIAVSGDSSGVGQELVEPMLFRDWLTGSALFELASGETLALDWSLADDGLSLRGRNGALDCAIVGDELECSAP